MKDSNNPTNPAFPVTDSQAPAADFEWVRGLTKREYFAGLAMQSFAKLVPACPAVTKQEAGWIAQYSVMCADALMAELAKS